MIIIAILVGILFSSLMEYALHNIYLHKSTHPHVKKHHTLFFGKKFSFSTAHPDDILSDWSYNLVNNIPAILLGVLLWNTDGIILMVSSILYTIWVEYVHLLIHKPMGQWLESTRVFSFLKEHHKIHHLTMEYNYGIGSHWWDVVIKTNKKKSNT